jgi:hypothetical protein
MAVAVSGKTSQIETAYNFAVFPLLCTGWIPVRAHEALCGPRARAIVYFALCTIKCTVLHFPARQLQKASSREKSYVLPFWLGICRLVSTFIEGASRWVSSVRPNRGIQGALREPVLATD